MIGFGSDEAILQKLRERLRRMTDEELIKFGKGVRRLAENPFQRQLEEARAEWKRRKLQSGSPFNRRSSNQACRTGVPIRCQVINWQPKILEG
jgi:hypothetical protein